MRWFFRSDFRSFYLLNATQFLGALNDNIFKLVVVYLLISVKGPASANTILSLAGAIFVIPFLLFSSGAGVIADRISKRTIVVFTKILELATVIYSIFAVHFVWEWGVYAALFLLATQSAIFGPSKYGIIPELVEEKKVSKANGSLTSFTYLAIVLGTFLASFLTDITDRNFVMVTLFCLVVAVVGLITSLGISRTQPQCSTKKINPVFVYEIYQTLKSSWHVPHLLPCIFGSSFFLFIGAFTQLNIIPFAMQSLHLSAVGGGYLFLSTAVGIAIGAVLSGQLSKDAVEPGISCIAGFFIALFFFSLYFFSSSLIATILSLGCLGVVGGGYLIPFDAYLQINSPDEKRGQIIAAANFFSFVGVLLASFCLYFISEELGFSAASGFAFMAVLTLIANIVNSGRLSALFFPFFANKVMKRFRKLKLLSPVPDPSTVVILHSNSWWDALLLFTCLPRLKILLPYRYFRYFPWINGWIESIQIIPPESKMEKKLFIAAEKFERKNNSVCLFIHKQKSSEEVTAAYKNYLSRLGYDVVFARTQKEATEKRMCGFRFTHKEITMTFTKE